MHLTYRLHVGPCAVQECTSKLRAAEIEAYAGTEHVMGEVHGELPYHAANMLNAALGFNAVEHLTATRIT